MHAAKPRIRKAVIPVGNAFDIGYSVNVLPDCKIIVIGYSTGHFSDFSLFRLNVDGSLDTTFNGPATTTLG